MKNNVFSKDGWKSTLIGILLGIASGVLLWFGKITWTEFAAFCPFWIGLCLVKDSLFKNNSVNDPVDKK